MSLYFGKLIWWKDDARFQVIFSQISYITHLDSFSNNLFLDQSQSFRLERSSLKHNLVKLQGLCFHFVTNLSPQRIIKIQIFAQFKEFQI